MALKVGELYIALTANVSGFTRSMAQAADQVEKTSKKIRNLSRDVSETATLLSAPFIAAASVAAKYDLQVSNATRGTQDQVNALAVEMGRVALPAIRSFNDQVGSLVRAFRALSPEAKATIGSLVEWSAKIAALSFAFSKLSNVAATLAGAIKTAFDIGLLNPFMLKLAVILGSVVALKVALDKTRVPSAAELSSPAAGGKPGASEWEKFATYLKVKTGMISDPKGIEKNWSLFKPPGESRAADIGKAVGDELGPVLKEILAAFSGASGGAVSGPHELVDVASPNRLQRAQQRSMAARFTSRAADNGGSLANLAPLGLQTAALRIIQDLRTDAEVFRDKLGAGLRRLGEDMTGMLLDVFASSSSMFAQIASSIARSGGDPITTAVNVVGTLLANSKQAQQLGQMLNEVFLALANTLGAVLEPLMPLVALWGIMAKVIGVALLPVLKGLEPLFRFLYDVVKAFYLAVAHVAKFLGDIFGFDTKVWSDAIKELNDTTFDNAVPALEGLADAAREASEQILNAPAGFRAGAYRYAATDTSGTGGGGGGMGGGGVNVAGDLIVQVADPKNGLLGASILQEIKRDRYLRTGTTAASGPKYGWGT